MLRGAPSFSGAERRSLGEGVREGDDAQRGAVAVVACKASLSRAPASWRAASAGVLGWEGLRQRGDEEGAACAHRASLHVPLACPRGSREVSHLFLRKRVSRKEISGGSVGLFVEEFFSDYGTRGVLSEGSVSVYPSHARKVLQQRRGQAARPQLVPLSIGVPAVVKHRRSGREQQQQHGLVP